MEESTFSSKQGLEKCMGKVHIAERGYLSWNFPRLECPDRYKAGSLFEWGCGKEMKKQQPIKKEINTM